MREDFSVIRDGLKRHRLNQLNERVAELQRNKQWKALKRMQRKRRHVAEYYNRLTAKQIADISENCVVAVGYPKGIKASNYRGNGKRGLRRKLTRWSYGRIIQYIKEKCAERGIKVETLDERRSSMICHQCGSRNTERLTQSTVHCYSCGLTCNADFNGAINIGSSFSAEPWGRGVQLNHPELRMIRPERLGSAEATGF
jgi:IS605 OrfB family transposase